MVAPEALQDRRIDRKGLAARVASGHGVDPGDTVELSFALTPYFAVVGRTYVDAARGELILYEDSYGSWSIAINGGNAAALTEAGVGDEVGIRPT